LKESQVWQGLSPTQQTEAEQACANVRRVLEQRKSLGGTTGVAAAISAAISLRHPLLVYPLGSLEPPSPLFYTDSRGHPLENESQHGQSSTASGDRRYPGVLLLRPGSTVEAVYNALKTPPLYAAAGEFVRAECWDCAGEAPMKRPLRKLESVVAATQMLRIMTNRKSKWQQAAMGK
jgi:hypothetical protein